MRLVDGLIVGSPELILPRIHGSLYFDFMSIDVVDIYIYIYINRYI